MFENPAGATLRSVSAPPLVGIDLLEPARLRDRLDRTRVTSPLAKAEDAVLVDTTGLDVDTVVARVMAIVAARLPEPGPGARASGAGAC